MKNKIAVLLLGILALAASSPMAGSKNPVVGGQEMYPTKDIIDNAINSADHTTLVAAGKAADLVDTFKGPRPVYRLCSNQSGVRETAGGCGRECVEAGERGCLDEVLTCHVVAGRLSTSDLKKQIKAGNGQATLKTVNGGKLVAMMQGKSIVLKDEEGDVSTVTIPNVFQSNGVIHFVDTVVLPN